jgi:TrmH family RNA methyltransferase
VRLVAEAVATRQRARLVLYNREALTRSASGASLFSEIPGWADRWYDVDERVMRAAAHTESPQGVLAVLSLPTPDALTERVQRGFGVLLDRLADPGNAGTILRTADAAGVAYVCAMAGSVDLFAPKVVRAGMGAHFHLSLYVDMEWEDVDRELMGVTLAVTDVGQGRSIYDVDWPESVALVVGSEARGVSEEARRRADLRAHVPMRSGVESLNASVAASIIIYSALGPGIASRQNRQYDPSNGRS